MSDLSNTQALAERLRAAGLRVTPQRLAIYQALVATDTHPSAQALYEQLREAIPSLSQATVYNTLQSLVEHGLAHDIGEAGDGATRYDGNEASHVNLICTNCHQVEDFFDLPLDNISHEVAHGSGYQLRGGHITFYGLCPRCQAELSSQHR